MLLSPPIISLTLIWMNVWIVVTISQTCYYPNGDVATGNLPCSNTTEFTNCCGGPSNCLANGLCLVNTDADTVEYGRGSCTDQSWSSPNCFAHCQQQPAGIPMSNGAAVFECDTVGYTQTADYCCETGPNQKTSCCKDPSLRFVLGAGTPTGMQPAPGSGAASSLASAASLSTSTLQTSTSQTSISQSTKVQQQSLSQSSTSVTSKTLSSTTTSKNTLSISTTEQSPAAASTQASNSSSLNMSPSNNGLSETVKIAIGVAIPVGVLLVALLAFLIWNNSRNSKKIRALQRNLSTKTTSWPFEDMQSPVSDYGTSPTFLTDTAFKAYESQLGRGPNHPHHEYYKPRPPEKLARRVITRSGLHEMSPEPKPPSELDAAPMRVVHPRSPLANLQHIPNNSNLQRGAGF